MKFALIVLLAIVSAAACTRSAPQDLDELRQRQFFASLYVERTLAGGDSYEAYLVSYLSAGLKVHAMIAQPKQAPPAGGYPILIANHGTVPDPAQYGIGADGVDARPGDYYRNVPEVFTSRGFLVVMPDYRGHNNSEGLEYTKGEDATAWYAEDVLALIAALPEIEDANSDEVYMWGHSLGAEVSLRVLLVTDVVDAASLWSTTDVSALFEELDHLSTPVILQHSARDRTAPAANSRLLATALRERNHPHEYHTYPGDEHFFTGTTRTRVVERDVAFLRQQ